MKDGRTMMKMMGDDGGKGGPIDRPARWREPVRPGGVSLFDENEPRYLNTESVNREKAPEGAGTFDLYVGRMDGLSSPFPSAILLYKR
jgi:hypothetical protein